MDDHKLTLEQLYTLETFYKDPSNDNYSIIKDADNEFMRSLGDKYQLFLLAIRKKYKHLNDPLTLQEEDKLNNEITRLTTDILTADDLDKLWVLYYATGDLKYPNHVSSVGNDDQQYYIVRQAALWSYQSHLITGRLS